MTWEIGCLVLWADGFFMVLPISILGKMRPRLRSGSVAELGWGQLGPPKGFWGDP